MAAKLFNVVGVVAYFRGIYRPMNNRDTSVIICSSLAGANGVAAGSSLVRKG